MTNDQQNTESGPIEVRKHSGRAVISIKNSITWKNCTELKKKLESKIYEGRTEVILDFKQVALLDSAALEMLIAMHDVLMKQGGVLKITGLNEVCRDILMATRIINIFFVYKDINEAVSHKRT
jgi:anti-anti-sigma factor